MTPEQVLRADTDPTYRHRLTGELPRLIIEIEDGLIVTLLADQEIEVYVVDRDADEYALDGEQHTYRVAPDGVEPDRYELAWVEDRSTIANPIELAPYWARIEAALTQEAARA